MAKQLDNSLAVLSRPASALPALAAAVFSLICLVGGAVVAAAAGNWPLTALLGMALVALAAASAIGYGQVRRANAALASRHLPWAAAIPEVQRQSLSVEVSQLSEILEVGSDQAGELQTAYIVAEDLALRRIQEEEDAPLLRHVSVGGVPFDALLLTGDVVTCIEVSFLVIPDLRQDRIDAVMRKIGKASAAVEKMRMGLRTRLMLLLVTQLTPADEEILKQRIDHRRFPETPVDIDIRFHDFEELQRIYIAE